MAETYKKLDENTLEITSVRQVTKTALLQSKTVMEKMVADAQQGIVDLHAPALDKVNAMLDELNK